MGEILECAFGMIYRDNYKECLVMIIYSIYSSNMVVIIKLVIILEDHLDL